MSQSSGGFELILSGVIFSLIGLWLDRRLGITPVLTITLAIVGFGGAVANVYYRYKRQIERLEAESAAIRKAGA